MKKLTLLFPFFCLLPVLLRAQSPSFPTSGDVYLGLKKLNVLGSVLYIAAHPDDENTRLLTYLAKDKLYRTGYLSLTRGDGGQNLVGDEQGIELGLIRTQELLSARRIDGAEQFFTRAFDFGYSKSPQETFTKWDKEKILSDVVWIIRKFQPDVVITRFPTTGEGGHGQHTASAILAVEAFAAAADASRFPEQLKWVKPWQAKRLLWNTFNFGGNNTTAPDQFKIDVGGFNPVLGKSYGEIASESRSQHKSQGFGVARTRGEAFEQFKTLSGPAPTVDLMEGLDVNWNRLQGAEVKNLEKIVSDLIKNFDFSAPQKSVSALVSLYMQLEKSKSVAGGNVWIDQKLKEVKELVASSSGLWMEAVTNSATATQGDSVQVTVVLNNRLGENIRLNKITGSGFLKEALRAPADTQLTPNRNFVVTQKLKLPAIAAPTQPYWLADKMSEGYYNVSDQQLIGQPDVAWAAGVEVSVSINGTDLSLPPIPLRYKFTDPVKGELYQPLAVLPSYSVTTARSATVLLPKKQWTQRFEVVAHRDADSLKVYEGSKLLMAGGKIKKGDRYPYEAPLRSAALNFSGNRNRDTLHYRQSANGAVASSLHTIRHDHIPTIFYSTPAANYYTLLDVKTVGRKIGYLVGAGDKVPEALEQMGYEVTLLTNNELERNNLKSFDAIISGVRAYNTADWLNAHYEKLMKYVEEGGNLIVQYNTSNSIGPVRAKIGPYPFNISRSRITDETAAVTMLVPGHPVFTYPNKITEADFSGWVQERSIYHAEAWDNHFTPLLRMNDPGEAPNDGSLVVAPYGKGFFTYTGLVFFRQLPAGVPGAYRLLANLIALNIKGS